VGGLGVFASTATQCSEKAANLQSVKRLFCRGRATRHRHIPKQRSNP
jgi:hypothetical protein